MHLRRKRNNENPGDGVGTIVASDAVGSWARTSEHEKVMTSPAGATAPSVMVRTMRVPETAEPVTTMLPVLAPVAVHVLPVASATKKPIHAVKSEDQRVVFNTSRYADASGDRE